MKPKIEGIIWGSFIFCYGLLLVVIIALIAGCGDGRPNGRAPVYQVRDCKAALRLVVTPEGNIPEEPAQCKVLNMKQYQTVVADVTRPYRIKSNHTT